MANEVRLELLLVERSARASEVVDRLVGAKTERQADVAELEVEVDKRDLVPLLRERHGQVRRHERLPRAAFRPENADHRRDGNPARDGGATAPRNRLLQRE